jgi:hypothetical protein
VKSKNLKTALSSGVALSIFPEFADNIPGMDAVPVVFGEDF